MRSDFHFRCFMGRSTPLYIGIILPVCTSLLINTVVLCVIMRSLSSSKQSIKRNTNVEEQKNETLHRIKIIFIFSAIFSLTWLCGIPILFTDHVFFQYAFCVTNSLQGFYIFCVYSLRDRQVVRAWKMLFQGRSVRQVNVAFKLSSTVKR